VQGKNAETRSFLIKTEGPYPLLFGLPESPKQSKNMSRLAWVLNLIMTEQSSQLHDLQSHVWLEVFVKDGRDEGGALGGSVGPIWETQERDRGREIKEGQETRRKAGKKKPVVKGKYEKGQKSTKGDFKTTR